MNKTQRWTYRTATALLFVSSFLFFALFFRGHLYYQEQLQLFLFTSSYFYDLAAFPGGVAAWIARFFTQFYLSAVPGALICAVFITGVQLLCSTVVREKTLLSRVCSFIPAFMLWGSMCETYSLLVPAVSVALSLAFVLICRSFKSLNVSAVFYILLTPVVYWICGPAVAVFVLSALSTRKWWAVAGSAAVFAVIPLLARPFVALDFPDLYFGRFLTLDPELQSDLALEAIALAAAFCAVFSFKIKASAALSWAILAATAIISGIIIVTESDFRFDEEQIYSNCVRNEDWDGIISMADKSSPMDRMSISCLNLALAMKGRLGDDMFKYVQAGTSALVPEYRKLHDDNLFISDVYYHMGFINPSQRHAFEAKEAIPSMEKSSRVYQRLVQTNFINGQYAAGQKYLDALSHTLFYRKWAADFNPDSPEMQRLKAWRQTEADYSFSEDNLFNEMGQMYTEHEDNVIVFQYAAAYALLVKDLDWFRKITAMRDFYNVPRHYQEAFLIIWMRTHDNLEGLPPFLSVKTVNRFKRFLEASRSISDTKYLFDKYGDTYWFYYSYNVIADE